MSDIKDIFISYGRKESLAFARKLYQRLTAAGYTAWFDFENIPKGDDYQKRIDNGIEMSHNFVFIIAPHAVASPYCRKEIELANSYKKRIVPMLHVDADIKEMHPIVQQTNWIYAREKPEADKPLEEWISLEDFEKAFQELVQLINVRRAYTEQHTILLDKALAWQRHEKQSRWLLSGVNYQKATEWLLTKFVPPEQPPCLPSDIHAEYICESKKYAAGGVVDIFMAYARSDAPIMNRFNSSLQQKGFSTWIDTRDGDKNISFNDSLEQGLQKAACVLYFISPEAMTSPFLQFELSKAQEYKKRIIAVLVSPTLPELFSAEAKKLTYLDCVDLDETSFTEKTKEITGIITTDILYYQLHRTYLLKALAWNQRQQSPDDLLDSNELQAAGEWLGQSATWVAEVGPTELHRRYIRESKKRRYREQISGLDVFKEAFISYNRGLSLEFVWDIYMRLADDKLDVWFDQNDIPLGVDFQSQIDQGIIKADNFIFVLSPGSIRSIYCLKELLLAIQYGKRIIPVLHLLPGDSDWEVLKKNVEQLKADFRHYRHPSSDNAVAILQKLNWLMFQEGKDDFEKSYAGLRGLIQSHTGHVKLHTQLLNQAMDWQRHQRSAEFLLTGDERKKAEAWLTYQFEKEQPPCSPSDIHAEFICDSRKNGENLATDVFICYAREDLEIRDKVRLALARHGITAWIHDKDILKGEDYVRAIDEGIEKADSLLFFISPESVVSEFCLKELAYAEKLNKRIIPLLIKKTDIKTQPETIRKLQYADFTDNAQDGDFEKDIDDILAEIRKDQDYYHQHKMFLCQALKWQKHQQSKSFMLRGYNLNQAQSWLKIARMRQTYPPLDLQLEFIQKSSELGASLTTDVFLSYSRANSDFARKLNQELQIHGKTTWFDQESIASGADFAAEINSGIENADNFLFILSPRAIASSYCTDEVEHARKFAKRFVTVLIEDIDPAGLHPELAKVQWIDFRPKVTQFSKSFGELLHTLDTDLAHVRMHTRLQMRQNEWFQKQRDPSLLLHGTELNEAEAWLSLNADKEPKPAPFHIDYIRISRQETRRRRLRFYGTMALVFLVFLVSMGAFGLGIKIGREGERKARIAAEEAEKQRLIAEERAKEAEKQRLIAEQKTAEATLQRTEAEHQRNEAEHQKSVADSQRVMANQNWQVAQENRNKAITNELQLRLAKIEELLTEGDDLNALLEGLQAGQRAEGAQIPAQQREAVIAGLHKVIRRIAEFNRLDATEALRAVAVSSDGQTVAAAGGAGAITVWTAGQSPRALTGHRGQINRLQFGPNGLLFSAGNDQTIRIWSKSGGEPRLIKNAAGPILDLAVSPDGTTIAAAVGNKTILVWSSAGELQQTLAANAMRVRFSGNAALISAGWDGSVRRWNLADGKPQTLIVSQNASFTELAVSADGKTLATANSDLQVQIWRITEADAQLQKTLRGHQADINSLSWSPDGSFLASAGDDKTVLIWRRDGQKLATLKGHTGPVQAAFGADGKTVISASGDKTVRFWRLNPIEPATGGLPELLQQGCAWLADYFRGHANVTRLTNVCEPRDFSTDHRASDQSEEVVR